MVNHKVLHGRCMMPNGLLLVLQACLLSYGSYISWNASAVLVRVVSQNQYIWRLQIKKSKNKIGVTLMLLRYKNPTRSTLCDKFLSTSKCRSLRVSKHYGIHQKNWQTCALHLYKMDQFRVCLKNITLTVRRLQYSCWQETSYKYSRNNWNKGFVQMKMFICNTYRHGGASFSLEHNSF